MPVKLAGEARCRSEKKQGDLFGRARNGSARNEKHMQVIRALWTARAFRPTRFIQRDLRFEEAKIGRKKKEERKQGEEKTGMRLNKHVLQERRSA